MRHFDNPVLGEEVLEPVSSRRTIQEEVYRRLSDALMTGRFDPGQMLTISSLAELFGTSHMPVREALRRLAAENALEINSAGSACVPRLTRGRLDDLCQARIIVEGETAALAASQCDPQRIRTLEHNVADHIAAGRDASVQVMMAKNREFHFTIYRASQSPVLIQLIETLWLRFGPYLRLLTVHMEPRLRAGDVDIFTRHHIPLIAALKRADGTEAQAHTIADIQSTWALLHSLVPSED